MSQRQTTVAERNHFIDLKLVGHTLEESPREQVSPIIASATGGAATVKGEGKPSTR